MNLTARLLVRISILIVAFTIVTFTIGRAARVEVATIGAVFILLMLVLGLDGMRKISVPLRKITEVVQAAMAGDLAGRVPFTRSDEIGFLAKVTNQMMAFLRLERAVMDEVLEGALGSDARAPKEVIDDLCKVATENLPLDGLAIHMVADADLDLFEPLPLADERAAPILAALAIEAAPGAYALPVTSATGTLHAVAIARASKPEALTGENLRYLRALLGALALHLDGARTRARARAELALGELARVAGRLAEPPGAPPDLEVAGRRIVIRRRPGASGATDVLEILDGRPQTDRVVIVAGDVLEPGGVATLARAALASACAAARRRADPHLGPADLLAQIASALHAVGGGGVTAALIAIGVRCADGGVELASAGGPRPLLVAGAEVRELAIAGPLAGARAGQRFETVAVDLDAGAALLAATDGVAGALRDRLLGRRGAEILAVAERALAEREGDDDATLVVAI